MCNGDDCLFLFVRIGCLIRVVRLCVCLMSFLIVFVACWCLVRVLLLCVRVLLWCVCSGCVFVFVFVDVLC